MLPKLLSLASCAGSPGINGAKLTLQVALVFMRIGALFSWELSHGSKRPSCRREYGCEANMIHTIMIIDE